MKETREVKCSFCIGAGQAYDLNCSRCSGTGFVTVAREIPPDVVMAPVIRATDRAARDELARELMQSAQESGEVLTLEDAREMAQAIIDALTQGHDMNSAE